MDFTRFRTILPNCVYAMHDYSPMGFPLGEPFEGRPEQKKKLRSSFERKVAFMRENEVPIWNGEFGPVYASASEPNHEKTNAQRYNLLQEQLKIYSESNISWSTWLYKDIGYQGMVYVDPESPWMRLLAPFLAKKKSLGVDFWGRDDKDVQHIYKPLLEHIEEVIPERFRREYTRVHSGRRDGMRSVCCVRCFCQNTSGLRWRSILRGSHSRSWTRWRRASSSRTVCRERG